MRPRSVIYRIRSLLESCSGDEREKRNKATSPDFKMDRQDHDRNVERKYLQPHCSAFFSHSIHMFSKCWFSLSNPGAKKPRGLRLSNS